MRVLAAGGRVVAPSGPGERPSHPANPEATEGIRP